MMPRIIVVSLHPAVDVAIEAPGFARGGVIAGKTLLREPAGKGINVARSLAAIGSQVILTGFVSRNDRDFFMSVLDRSKIQPQLIPVEAQTRENITLVDRKLGDEAHILSEPSSLSIHEFDKLAQKLAGLARKNDYMVFAGSVPRGITLYRYRELIGRCNGGRVCVDAANQLLHEAVKMRLWAVKPNVEELSMLAGRALSTREEIVRAGRHLLKRCENVLVSNGKEGAILLREDGAWEARLTKKIRACSTVGCGDALFAGFISSMQEGKAPAEALKMGMACGSACALVLSAVASKGAARAMSAKVAVKELT